MLNTQTIIILSKLHPITGPEENWPLIIFYHDCSIHPLDYADLMMDLGLSLPEVSPKVQLIWSVLGYLMLTVIDFVAYVCVSKFWQNMLWSLQIIGS